MARTWHLPVVFAVAASLPGTARAMGAVVGKEGEEVAVGAERIAVATSAGQTALWAQVSVVGAGAGFVWIVPVSPGGKVDLASDAWLDALDAATSPVVLPPPPLARDVCSADAGLTPQTIPPVTSPTSARPARSALFTDLPSLAASVAAAGYALPADLSAALAPLFAGGTAFFAATYETSALPTRTLRIVGASGEHPPVLPLALTRGAGAGAPVTAFVVAAESATAGASPLAIDPSTVLWLGDAQSTYPSARDALLAGARGSRWLTESTLPDLLFDGASAPLASPAPRASLPSLLSGYFALARAYGDGDPARDPAACASAALGTRADVAPYAASCAAGALAVAPGPDACALVASPPDAGTPIDALLCGAAADDAALAVAGLPPAGVWITRIDGLAVDGNESDVPLSIASAPPASPILTAAGYAVACAAPPAATPVPSLPTSSAPPPSSAPPESSSGSSSASDVAPAVAEGCGAAIESCGSSDSSDESDDSGGCGSSDPKSDSEDDSSSGGCGSSDSKSDDSSSNDCQTGRRARTRSRSPVSRILLALAAIGAVARRRKTRRA